MGYVLCPPVGHGPHRYYFDLYAVSVPTLNLPAGSGREAVELALKDHILSKTLIVGTFERKG